MSEGLRDDEGPRRHHGLMSKDLITPTQLKARRALLDWGHQGGPQIAAKQAISAR